MENRNCDGFVEARGDALLARLKAAIELQIFSISLHFHELPVKISTDIWKKKTERKFQKIVSAQQCRAQCTFMDRCHGLNFM